MPETSGKNSNFKGDIIKSDIDTVVRFSQTIPEFDNPPDHSEYHRRLDHVPHLILIAKLEGKLSGFKVGYERDGNFYSWMGGVLPAYRKRGVAKALAKYQEDWANKKSPAKTATRLPKLL